MEIAIGLIVVAAIWIVAAVLVAGYAEGKGHSFGLYLLLGLITSPVVSLIVAMLVPDQTLEEVEDVDDDLDRLQRLGELRASGVLSEDEFAAQKSRILAEQEGT